MPKVSIPLQGELQFGGRGSDRIVEVQKYDRTTWLMSIDTKHGARQVVKLDLDSNRLMFYGDSRVPPFATLQLTENGAKKVRREIKKAYDWVKN